MDKLNITSKVLDRLGFSEYWDGDGTSGARTLKFSNGWQFRILEIEENDDDSEGYSHDGKYVARHWVFVGWHAVPKLDTRAYNLFFLHEMYECIAQVYPQLLAEFVKICRAKKMGYYIDEYIKTSTNV